jgi:hypothetical protein
MDEKSESRVATSDEHRPTRTTRRPDSVVYLTITTLVVAGMLVVISSSGLLPHVFSGFVPILQPLSVFAIAFCSAVITAVVTSLWNARHSASRARDADRVRAVEAEIRAREEVVAQEFNLALLQRLQSYLKTVSPVLERTFRSNALLQTKRLVLRTRAQSDATIDSSYQPELLNAATEAVSWNSQSAAAQLGKGGRSTSAGLAK